MSLDPVFPTDLCIGPDGWVYLTDSTRNQKYDDGRLWRCNPSTGSSELLHSVPWFPNGITFGPDDRLYVASSGDKRIYVCDWDSGQVGPPRVFCELPEGRPDGLAFDADGTLLVAAVGSDGGPGFIALVTPQGEVAQIVEIGASTHYTNLALGTDEHRLVLTDATTGAVLVTRDHAVLGLELHPFRDHDSLEPGHSIA
ncbi:SMP-30/gluconolactonase/LRE family protein [Aeromicrobium sp. A1-2]|uniref:SMP-30/gluconolactonase/LRE family protein n=1 Tax=Aeromicrobium sp. A1-2 TaxID=2107713 RepID=UPI0013C330C5|nr:SMP-30/gluconolactonase/LRE family protein [Aeromicrobium sp. A1-2]